MNIKHVSVDVTSDQMRNECLPGVNGDIQEFACRKLNEKIKQIEQEVGEIGGTILKFDVNIQSYFDSKDPIKITGKGCCISAFILFN